MALFGRGEFGQAQEHLEQALAAGVEPHPQFAADLERAAASAGREESDKSAG